jgi:hypothetical protein
MTRAVASLLASIIAAPAFAETVAIATSTVTLQATDAPGAVAELVFQNDPTNGPQNDGNYTLSIDGLTVTFRFEWDAMGSDDGLRISVPEGFTVMPPFLAVPEGGTGRALIYAGDVPVG